MRAESGLIDLESGHGRPQCLETWAYHHGLAQTKRGGEVGDGSFRASGRSSARDETELTRDTAAEERSGQVQVTQEVKTNKASDRKIALPQIKRNREEKIRVLKKNYFAP